MSQPAQNHVPTPEQVIARFQFVIWRLVSEVAPHQLNKHKRRAWVATRLGIGADRVRKACHGHIRRVEHHEFVAVTAKANAMYERHIAALRKKIAAHDADNGKQI